MREHARARVRARAHARAREGKSTQSIKKWIEGRDTRQRQIEMRRHARMNARTRAKARAETRAETRAEMHAQARAETRAREGTNPKFTKNGLKEKHEADQETAHIKLGKNGPNSEPGRD